MGKGKGAARGELGLPELSPRVAGWLLVAVMGVALALRLWGLDAGLPVVYHPDEPDYVRIAQRIFKTGDLNPYAFNYPSLFFYLNALAYLPFYGIGKLTGEFASRGEIAGPVSFLQGITTTVQPDTFMVGRLLTVAFGVASVALLYMIGRDLLRSRWAGLLAALLLAVSVPHVTNSRLITPDTFLIFFILFAFWGAVQVLRHGEWRHYVIAGVGIGLVGGTKYNGVLIALALVIAHFMRRGRAGIIDWRLPLAAGVSAVVFLITTPFSVLDYPRFMADLRYEATHYSTGHLGMEGETLRFYLSWLRDYEGPVVLLALAGMVRGFALRVREIVLLSAFPLLYFVFINQFVVRNDRTLMPLLPFVYLLGAHTLLVLAWARLPRLKGAWRRGARWVLASTSALLLIATVAYPLDRAVWVTMFRMGSINVRQEAMRWIERNVPGGASVAIEAYSPYVDPARYAVTGVTRMSEYPTEWYIENGVDYLVFSKFTFNRIYNARDRFPEEAARYDQMFSLFEPLQTFPHGDYEIRIYRNPSGDS
jgi:4-amino-4-deoxy-L-arabinose transferase-like glycosyltransferase